MNSRVKAYRKSKSITQNAFANFLNMNRSTFAYKERYNSFTAEEIEKIAEVLGVTKCEIICGKEKLCPASSPRLTAIVERLTDTEKEKLCEYAYKILIGEL